MRSVSFWLAIGMLGAASSAAAAPAATIYISNCTKTSPQITVGGTTCATGTGTVYSVPACGNVPIVRATDCAVPGAEALCQLNYNGTCTQGSDVWYGTTLGKQGITNTSTLRTAEQDELEAAAEDMEAQTPWDTNCDCDAGGVTWR
jgi:predicted RNA-binding Zn-ribbon protein involved in translation (DUF1610 family)